VNNYDYIIAGGGCAGLSLVLRLLQSPLKDKRILIIDADTKTQNDRTWAFWSKEEDPLFQPIIAKTWDRLQFSDESGSSISSIQPFTYQLIQGIDFYRYAKSIIQKADHVDTLTARISHIGEDATGPFCWANDNLYRAQFVFNSCFTSNDLKPEQPEHYFMLQHFLGWRIKTKRPIFDPQEATLMDFRGPQKGNARFYYLLPFSEREALVEYTLFSGNTLQKEEYRQALRVYMNEHFEGEDFEIVEEEYGVIPMTNKVLSSRTRHPHVVQIGTRSGMVKPTTGYAFLRIQQQTQAIVDQLRKDGTPFIAEKQKSRFRFYDTLLLHILHEEGHLAKQIFSQLFQRNSMLRILTFLNEKSTIWQEARIFASLPMNPFLKALFKTQLRKAVHWWSPERPATQLNRVK
jgi:lycopene beta-cyclase